jgi:hypothetical protein
MDKTTEASNSTQPHLLLRIPPFFPVPFLGVLSFIGHADLQHSTTNNRLVLEADMNLGYYRILETYGKFYRSIYSHEPILPRTIASHTEGKTTTV